MNRKAFFDALRGEGLNLTTQNVMGIEKVLDYALLRKSPLEDLSYILATAWWETAQTMHPVTEAYWLSEAWRKKNLRYYPWHGRGLIQTTWEENYETMDKELGLDGALLRNPDMLLEWEYSLPALFIGMEKGLYTTKKLDDYLDGVIEDDKEQLREYSNARRTVNGTDKQVTIGQIALSFQRALVAGGYNPDKSVVIPTEKPKQPISVTTPTVTTPPKQNALVRLLESFLKWYVSR